MPALLILPALAALLAVASLRGERARSAYRARRLAEQPAELPPASVIVPVKGADEGLRENLAALASLDYPDYELLVTARRAEDIPAGVLPASARIVLGGTADAVGEKAGNLMAAVHAARVSSEVFAFADSDGLVGVGWLRALVAPLAESGVGASTGYRWYAPRRRTPATLLRAEWNAVIAGSLGAGDCRFAWGGAMAIRRATFVAADVLECWKRAVSDDYALSAAVHRQGLSIAYAPGATVACVDSVTMRGLLMWARRQLILTRFCDPPLWRAALAAHTVYCAGMVAALTVGGWAWGLLAVQLAAGMAKAWRRAARAKALPPWLHALLSPMATWLWLATLVASAIGHTIEWRGIRYRL